MSPDQHPDVAHSPEPSTQSTTRPASPAYPAGSSATATLVVTALLVLTQLYAAIPLLAPIALARLGGAGASDRWARATGAKPEALRP